MGACWRCTLSAGSVNPEPGPERKRMADVYWRGAHLMQAGLVGSPTMINKVNCLGRVSVRTG